jgi:carboxymethylenebutenolidase
MSELVSIPTPDGPMPGHVWRPGQGSGPGLLLVQEIFGVSAYIERRAADLAELGYVVLAPEFFWRLGVARVESGPAAMEEGSSLLQRLDWVSAVADGVRAVEHLRGRDDVEGGVGMVGFCLGGGLAFNIAAETATDALVSYYGSGLPELLGLSASPPGVPVLGTAAVQAPSLHHFGLADSFIERPMVERIEAALSAVPGVTFLTYEGADHAFDNPDFHLYDETTARLAWQRTTAWLAEHLPAAPRQPTPAAAP